jgi:site-specific recombinase XerD
MDLHLKKLELRDLDLMKGSLFVHPGKGKKGRVVPISGAPRPPSTSISEKEGRAWC